jgi:hypothetical protein
MCWGIKNSEVSVDDVKNVHKLSLVFMNSLDLNVIHCIYWNIISSLFFDPVSKFSFVFLLNLDELILELLIFGIWNQISQIVKSSNPFIYTSKSVTDKI